MSASAALALASRAAANWARNDALLGTQDKMTSRTSVAETIHEIVESRILLVGGERLDVGERRRVAAVEAQPKLGQPLPFRLWHAGHRLPHLNRRCPAAQNDPAHRP